MQAIFCFSPKPRKIAEVFPELAVVPCQYTGAYGTLPVWWSLLNSNEYDRFCCLLLFADAKIRKFRLQLLWHYNRQPLGMNETWHLEGLMSHLKKIHIVANSWVQDQQGMYPLFDWYLKLFPMVVVSLPPPFIILPNSSAGVNVDMNGSQTRKTSIEKSTSHFIHHITMELFLFPSSKSDDIPVKPPLRPLVGEHRHRLPSQFLQNTFLKGLKVTFF